MGEWWKYFVYGTAARALSFALQAVVSQLPDHDADAYRAPEASGAAGASLAVEWLYGGFGKWDAQHFLHTALAGYGEVYQHAFMPVLPGLLALFGTAAPAGVLSSYHAALVGGVLTSATAFGAACADLRALAERLATGDADHRRTVSICACAALCASPASVFHSAVYTESLFMALTFRGLLLLHGGSRAWAVCFLAVATGVRSNGMVAAGFVAHEGLRGFLTTRAPGCLAVTLLSVFVVLPYLLWEAAAFFAYCRGGLPPALAFLGMEPSAISAADAAFCDSSVPHLYAHVQEKYWGNGLFAYWRLKQLPNWCLAAPVLAAAAWAVRRDVALRPAAHRSLGLLAGPAEGRRVAAVLHLAFLAVFAALIMRVEVATRLLLSASPLLYVVSGEVLAEDARVAAAARTGSVPAVVRSAVSADASAGCRLLSLYGALYVGLGHLLHCNFYPWT